MAYSGLMWECSCGHIERGDLAPEECSKCASLESFIQLPEELVAEREKDLLPEISEPLVPVEPLTLSKTTTTKKTVKKTTKAKKKRK